MCRMMVAFHIKMKLKSQMNSLIQRKIKYLEVVYWVK